MLYYNEIKNIYELILMYIKWWLTVFLNRLHNSLRYRENHLFELLWCHIIKFFYLSFFCIFERDYR